MELRALWKVLLRRWPWIAAPGLAALAVAAYSFFSSPAATAYAVTVRYTAATPPGQDGISYEDESYFPWVASEYLVGALKDWVRTSSFATEVSAMLAAEGITLDRGAIQGSISAEHVRSVMTITVTRPDAAEAVALAEAVGRVLRERTSEYFPQVGAEAASVIALDLPSAGAVPPSISSRLDPLLRFAIGLAAGVGLAFLIEYLDPRLRERQELERMGFTVLAEIPRRGS